VFLWVQKPTPQQNAHKRQPTNPARQPPQGDVVWLSGAKANADQDEPKSQHIRALGHKHPLTSPYN
ncbi:hypothetical protein, partial [Cupriavidus sp. SK-3]|uniref:hypothetical protein n=1 Tax=Cupriavidus sp. SK-3 TaxID=1470558 RepID=UPI001F30436F